MSHVILVVDDDEVLGQVLRRVLIREGYAVILAATIAQALRLAREFHPRLALLDVCLPDGDGRQLGRDLRAMLPEVGLVLMTAFPLTRNETHQPGEQVVELLKKPVGLDDLRRTIAATLANGEECVPGATSAARQPCSSP
jgi:two-component system response regulator MprA